MKALAVLLAAAALGVAGLAARPSGAAAPGPHFTVHRPEIVVSYDQINPTFVQALNRQSRYIDAQLTTFTAHGARYWFNANAFTTTLYRGDLAHPFETKIWSTPTPNVIRDPSGAGGRHWITSLYQDRTGVLAFIHTEYSHVVDDKYQTGRGRVGLAWSTDGQHFTYLGHILVPHGDPAEQNVQGAPYLIKDGFFYVYFKDRCAGGNNAVARAPVAEVLAAARAGALTPWRKYDRGAWSSPGRGGACSAIRIEDGIIHTDAAYSTYTHKYYLLTSTMNWGGRDTWIRLNESADGLTWKPVGDIVRQPADAVETGYQYVSIVDESGADNARVGRRFYVYSAKDIQTEAGTVYRWLVDLDGAGGTPGPLPSCTLSLRPATAAPGQSVQLSWRSSNATRAALLGVASNLPASGAYAMAATRSGVVTLQVDGPGGPARCAAALAVSRAARPAPQASLGARSADGA